MRSMSIEELRNKYETAMIIIRDKGSDPQEFVAAAYEVEAIEKELIRRRDLEMEELRYTPAGFCLGL